MTTLRHRRWPMVLLAGPLAAAAWAQTTRSDADAPHQDPTQVLSDVQPLPAEDRDSTGVLLDATRMRAHEGTAATRPPDNAVQPIADRGISRLVDRTRTWDDVREAGSTQVPAGEASGAPADPASQPAPSGDRP